MHLEKNMLSSKILNILYLLKNNTLPCSAHVNFLSTSSITLNFMNREDEKDEKDEKKLKDWRQSLLPPNPKADKKIYDPDKGFFGIFKIKVPFTPWEMKRFVKSKVLDNKREEQKLNISRCQVLGYDLSLAYFLICQGGKVKFKQQDEWISMETDKIQDILPKSFDSNVIVEEIDASNILLFYEGLENFENVTRIKKAIFKNSPLFDDWFLDKISTILPRLEYLDVSNCPKLTERGLEGLYRASNLKKLIITNNKKSAAFELTCMMLEDCLPKLKIEILDPPSEKSVVNIS